MRVVIEPGLEAEVDRTRAAEKAKREESRQAAVAFEQAEYDRARAEVEREYETSPAFEGARLSAEVDAVILKSRSELERAALVPDSILAQGSGRPGH